MDPQVMRLISSLAGVMLASWWAAAKVVWEAHKRCPRCAAAPGRKHSPDCDLRERL